MIITTTDTIEGYRITEYFAPVVANIVAGTGFVSDFLAGFTDTFGGRSESYQHALSMLYADATREIEAKSARCGANAAVGARFEFSQISGKGMQMFMVNAVATPVVTKTEATILAEATAKQESAQAAAEAAESRAALWQGRLAERGPLHALLDDPAIAESARRIRAMYGDQVCASFLVSKADELSMGVIELTAADLPEKL